VTAERVASDEAHDVATRHLARLAETLLRIPAEPLGRAVDLLLAARAAGRRVWVFGNGGSAAIASHLVCDLTKTAARAGEAPLRSFALTDNVPLLTAWANDTAYERVFAAQIEMLVDPDDVVIAISSSGRSPNIVAAVRSARDRGARIIALVGFDGGPALDLADVAIHIPVHDYGIVEDAHMAVGHAMAAAVRASPREVRAEL
jgi:D-sedoheptulose 7-phosphate isomerase